MTDLDSIFASFQARVKPAQGRVSTKPAIKKQSSDTQLRKLKELYPDFFVSDHALGIIPLVFLENYPGLVQVPNHWEQGSFAPRGRTELTIPPSLQPLCQARLQELAVLEQKSVRQLAAQEVKVRASQPQAGKSSTNQVLDALSKQLQLLPFGELYDGTKSRDLRNQFQFERGQLTERLLQALNYADGDTFVWRTRMQKLGIVSE